MKLNEYELDYVKYFIQVKGYHQYEVLAEIMDHFVLILEEQKAKYPDTPFEELVDETYCSLGKVMFEEINHSTISRVTNKYKSTLLKNTRALLDYKYVFMMAVGGIVLYQLQSYIHNYNGYPVDRFTGVFGLSKYVIVFLGSMAVTATGIGDPKFACNKIAKRYSYYLFFVVMSFELIIRVAIRPISFGFNMYYLITAVAIVAQIVILYVIIKTARTLVQENQEMEEVYQILK